MTIAKISIAPLKAVVPAMLALVEDTSVVLITLSRPLEDPIFVARPAFASRPKEQHLLDLVRVIPIRGPSLTA